MEVANFWEVMIGELLVDFEEVMKKRVELGVQEYRYPDGRWEIVEFERARGVGDVPWRDPVKPPEEDEWMEEAVSVKEQEARPVDSGLQLQNLNPEGVEKVVTSETLPERENETLGEMMWKSTIRRLMIYSLSGVETSTSTNILVANELTCSCLAHLYIPWRIATSYISPLSWSRFTSAINILREYHALESLLRWIQRK